MAEEKVLITRLNDILKTVEKPGRYLGGEWNAVRKNSEDIEVRVGLVFPDVYEIGMSYLGQKILYALLNAMPSVSAERVFAPWPDFESRLREHGLPLFSLESRTPLGRFDILGFSLLYELNATNILTVLNLGRIPLLSKRRRLEDPLVIAGGPAVFNPEPLAGVFDLMLIGEGEEAFPEIIELFKKLKGRVASRESLLAAFAELQGVYVPSLYSSRPAGRASLVVPEPSAGAPKRIGKRVLRTFSASPFPVEIVVPNIQVVFDRVSVEVARGCPQRCRFCQATSIYFPYRVKDPSSVIDTTRRSLRSTGYDESSLAALSISDYPYLEDTVRILMDSLSQSEISLSLSSLRPGGLSGDLVENIIKVRKTGFTLVPEAGTERLRRVINKNLTDRDLQEAAGNAFSRGWRLLKLYFMIGLPTERGEDLEGLVHMVEEVVKTGKRILGKSPQVNVSISSFIPKPHTPFQWLAMEEASVLNDKQKRLHRELKKFPSVKVKTHNVQRSFLEAVFSRGDRRLLGPLLEAWEQGSRFDGWKDFFNFQTWEKAFAKRGVDPRNYLEELPLEAELPWDIVDTGLHKSSLERELKKAQAGEMTSSCLEADCRLCGACLPSLRVGRTFEAEVIETRNGEARLGTETRDVHRYRAFYAKTGRMRYISHIDLTNLIRRSFRRAGVAVLFSSGFHPKMLMSFLPALPLGMEGKAECLEFRSRSLLEEKSFLLSINACLPAGVEFAALEELSKGEPALNEAVEGFIYSVDIESKDILDALNDQGALGKGGIVRADVLLRLISRKAESEGLIPPSEVDYDPKEKKLLLRLESSLRRAPRPQTLVQEVLRIEYPTHVMAREKAIFTTKRKIDKPE